ncbi:MAG: hypothetical protein CML23_16480 [Rhizobiaceae bacterium]|nr:hypothetical protein [Rhizobiaceae bacterium]
MATGSPDPTDMPMDAAMPSASGIGPSRVSTPLRVSSGAALADRMNIFPSDVTLLGDNGFS